MSTFVDTVPDAKVINIVRRIAASLTGWRGPWVKDYDDMVQDALVALWETDPDPHWWRRRAHNAMIDGQRVRYGRGARLALNADMKSLDEAIAGALTDEAILGGAIEIPELGYQAIEDLDLIERALVPLSGRHAEIVIRTGSGETLIEVAEDWGVTEGRVCQVRQAARKKVHAHLASRPPP